MRNEYYQMNATDVHCRRISKGIQKPLYVVMIADQMKHDHVLFRLSKHDTTALPKAQLKNSTQMNLAHAQPGVTMGLAERQRKFLHGIGELQAEVVWSVFELTLDAARQHNSHVRRRGLVMVAANAAGDSWTWATPSSNSVRASCAR